MTNARPSRRKRFALHLLVWLAATLLVGLRFGPPPPRFAAPDAAFSAGRGLAVLGRVLGEERPHPRGSAENRAVRERIEAELRALGLEPRVDRASGCRGSRCAPVENVVATIRGRAVREGRDGVLLACHYDSVPTGPGASDDGAGVATLLEVARALLRGGGVERDVVLLFDDGEEEGLLGADAFVREAPEFARVGVVVNVEARGTSGPSMMFEVKHARLGAIRAMAGALDRPVTSSLFGGIYERMPNDTDLTVFGRAGLLGFNFAFIRDVVNYHRTTDDLAHLDPGSLQHHGDNTLAMVRTLASRRTSLEAAVDEPRAVWFDFASLVVIVWPEPWSLPTSMLLVVGAGLAVRRRIAGARLAAALAGSSVLLSLAFVPASPLLLAPALVATAGLGLICVSHGERRERAHLATSLVTTFVAGVLWSEVFFGLRDAFF
ncbi:MAG: M20/M25/M40 family metallo-hydrolase [Deltaproteobacteria bacterium]|nr:M20/M25/M40 family metallo-hydrolase [Deltaproteobacteria bacterium]